MAKNEVVLKKADSILDELERLQQAISHRAYELFRTNGAGWGDALRDWLTAEREIVSKPAVELRQADGWFDLKAAMPGTEAKDLTVQVTAEDLLITGRTPHKHEAAMGTVHVCEFGTGTAFRSIHFPEPVDPESAKAEFKNGMLHVTLAIAERLRRGR